MRRRQFIAGLGSAAAWPVVARAQQGDRVRRVGVLMDTAESNPDGQARIAAFRGILQGFGWIECRNIQIDYRWGGGDAARTYAYAAVWLCSGSAMRGQFSSPGLRSRSRHCWPFNRPERSVLSARLSVAPPFQPRLRLV